MKSIAITLCLILALTTCALAQKTVTVWQNGKPTLYQVYPNGNVVGMTPGQSGLITGNLNNGNLFDNRLPAPDPVNPSPYVGGSPWVGGSPYVK